MTLGHEKLDVYRLSIAYVAWVYEKALDKAECRMLSRLGGRGYCVKEDPVTYGAGKNDFDPDSDFDPDKGKSQQAHAPDTLPRTGDA